LPAVTEAILCCHSSPYCPDCLPLIGSLYFPSLLTPSLAVGEFRKLALLAEADGHLRQKLQQVLKLSKEKWDEARDHAMRAVVADNRMRIW
jgi:hypothetical protein